jgi:putative helicase MOV10L1
VDGPPELGAQPALAAVVKRQEEGHPGHSGGSVVRSNPLARVLFFGVRGRQAREGKGEAPSFFNAVEAQELVNLVEAWLTRGEGTGDLGDRLKVSDVGVVAPYRSQVIRIRNLLRARNLGAVRVGTVDDYQGQEEKVMFISTVVSRAPSKHLAAAAKAAAAGSAGEASVASLRLGFLACPRRFNVAISRAKALNVVVGHPVALTHWPHWHSLLQHCYSRGAFLGAAPSAYRGWAGARKTWTRHWSRPSATRKPDDEADFEELKRAVDMIAELSLLGGGDVEELWPDDDEMMASAFQEDREWRVAL